MTLSDVGTKTPELTAAFELPAVSVVVPTYNRPRALRRCLSALAASDYPRERIYVVVVDDGGTVDLAPVLERFRDGVHIRCIRRPNAGPAAARNAGAQAAAADWIAFIDDDCAPRTDWLRRLVGELRANPDALVGGRSANALVRNPYAAASQIIIDTVHAHFNREPRAATFLPSDNLAMARRRLLEIGGFDERFRWSEDRDLCDRWTARGWPLVLVPEARIDHAHQMGLGGFVRQHFGYGRGAWRFHRGRTERGTGELEVEGSFYLECFHAPFKARSLRQALPLAALLGVWQCANAAGFFFEALRARRARPSSPRSASRIAPCASAAAFRTEQVRAGG